MGGSATKWAVNECAGQGHGNVDRGITALLVIDPYNDFISEGGKFWDRVRGVAEANRKRCG